MIVEPSYTDTTLMSDLCIPRDAAILSTNDTTPPLAKNSSIVNSRRTPSMIASLGLIVNGQSGVMKNSRTFVTPSYLFSPHDRRGRSYQPLASASHSVGSITFLSLS